LGRKTKYTKIILNRKYGLGDANGKLLSEIKYDRIEQHSSNPDIFVVSIFKPTWKQVLMDSIRKEITEIKFDYIDKFFGKKGLVSVYIGNNLDNYGEVI
jgi:hypothetical protein